MLKRRSIAVLLFALVATTTISLIPSTATATEYGIVLIDRSGSMTVERYTNHTRFEDAVYAARLDVAAFYPPVDQYAVMSFNGDDGLVMHLWFTSDMAAVDAAIQAIPPAIIGPRTPLADAMCQASEILKNMVGGRWLLGYTDGDENDSDGSFFDLCDPCDVLYATGWLDFCDPSDLDPPCTDLQLCIVAELQNEAVHTWRYFNNPIVKSGGGAAPSPKYENLEWDKTPGDTKDITVSEDFLLLQYLSDVTGGEFATVPDDPALIADRDFDGVDDVLDNCPDNPNPDQADADGDLLGDVCDPFTCVCPNQGDYDGDGFRTSLDLAQFIDVLFAGDPDITDPDCPSSRGDFDCDGFATSLDLAKMIDYLFAGGSPPCDPCN